MIIHKSFKYRLYPNKEQEQKLTVQFGHARFVYNYFMNEREKYYAEHKNNSNKKGLNYFDTVNMLSSLKNKDEFLWLKEAHSQVLQQSLKNLDIAYRNFFEKRSNYPSHKKKNSNQSIRYPQDFKILQFAVFVPKIGKIKAVIHRLIEGKPKNITISKTKSGKYFVSVMCEINIIEPIQKNGEIGIDVGIKNFIVCSDGTLIDNPKYLIKSEKKLNQLQRQFSRKIKGSNNKNKIRIKIARQYEKITNQRKDFLHKISHEIVLKYGFIAIENLNIKGMTKNHCLAKHILDAAFSEFFRQLQYKSEWYGSWIEKIDRFAPSSKLCHVCGYKNEYLTLSDRKWICPKCKTHHDRDKNASINILNFARAGIVQSYANGDNVIPIRR